jgi:GNAT superfamily N-acetyltransferase
MSEIRIIPLDRSLLRESAEVIARAFRTEASTSHNLDLSDERALERVTDIMVVKLTLHRQAGHPTLVAVGPHGVLGVAVVKSPHVHVGTWQSLRMALPRVPRLLGLLRHVRYRNALGSMRHGSAMRPPEDLPKPYHTLEVLAVRPETQGQSIGRLLLQAVADVAQADATSNGTYLTTAEARTRDYYQKNGYRPVSEVPAGALCAYHMFRPREQD